jgi:ribosomal protein L24
MSTSNTRFEERQRVVITGKDRGKRGRVLKVLPAKNRA